MDTMQWQIKHFDDLTKLEFHNLVQLREKVFVVEQDCPYLDVDGTDLHAYHLLVYKEGVMLATARIFPPDENDYVIIGRICNDTTVRGRGIGKELVKICLEFCQSEWSDARIKISAQCYLITFYESLGFKTIGEEYLEDGIPHITMVIES